MPNKGPCSEPLSELIRLFVERSGATRGDPSPEQVMTQMVERTIGRRGCGQEQALQRFLESRNVFSLEISNDLSCDGMISPIGASFPDGFKMCLQKSAPRVRQRFTMAHEACHTFFYEFAPELKFRPHETDDTEERLCNLGAAVLLIPSSSLRKRSLTLPVCLNSLEQLAEDFGVSLATMFLRLRALRLWDCELSTWHRTTVGSFVLDRLYRCRRRNWQWLDSSILNQAWVANHSIFGSDFIYVTRDTDGRKAFRPVVYNVRRFGSGLMALWGRGIREAKPSRPLFQLRSSQPRTGLPAG